MVKLWISFHTPLLSAGKQDCWQYYHCTREEPALEFFNSQLILLRGAKHTTPFLPVYVQTVHCQISQPLQGWDHSLSVAITHYNFKWLGTVSRKRRGRERERWGEEEKEGEREKDREGMGAKRESHGRFWLAVTWLKHLGTRPAVQFKWHHTWRQQGQLRAKINKRVIRTPHFHHFLLQYKSSNKPSYSFTSVDVANGTCTPEFINPYTPFPIQKEKVGARNDHNSMGGQQCHYNTG